jgi:NAD(P)-dependent dehydrogenase (short-subunit alcohol dehydrogenase family)
MRLKKEDEESVNGKIVVITGANSGNEPVAALEFAKCGAILVSCCRDVE